MNASVLEMIKRSAAIPSMPQVATRFLEIIQDPDFEFAELADVLSTDPGTASEVLRLANSSLFGVTRKVTSLQQAMSLLGLKRVRSLVLGRYIVDSIDHKSLHGVDRSYYWRRSLCTAVLASRLADIRTPSLREEAFIAGLLADVGIVILDETMPTEYRHIAQQHKPHGPADLALIELETINITHGQASAVVLDHWHLPEPVCDAVRWHPWESQEQSKDELARVVGAADRIGKYLCETTKDVDPVIHDCRRILECLELDPPAFTKAVEDIEVQIEDFANILRIDVIASNVYQMIANALRELLVSSESATA